ncbi:MAG: alanyl-tRNA editing protein AlaXM [Sulfolobaceae archaeon]|nr:alanyl-tRNA editing protein AlaXM [Sulfolobaceae archaeon]
MVEKLYLTDSYIKNFNSKIIDIRENKVYLEKTAFYPGGGGLDFDIGFLKKDERVYKVIEVGQEGDEIYHKLETTEGLSVGDVIYGEIDWNRRYRMMRLHTASHIIAAIAYTKYNALITGGHITPEYAKDDFNIEDKNLLPQILNEANEIAKRNIDVKVYFLQREEALKIPGIVKLAERMPPEVQIWRIVEIPGIDIQADGGPHVKNTGEIGDIVLLKIENRGKNRKRVYYTVKP